MHDSRRTNVCPNDMQRRTLLLLLSGALAAVPSTAALAQTIEPRWRQAAATLKMPVLRASVTLGLRLQRIATQRINCGPIKEQFDAYYRRPSDGARLRIAEGKPQYCGDLGDAPVLQRGRVHGRRATLYRYCEGPGCTRARNAYALVWSEQGITITLISRGLGRQQLFAVAASMQPVPG
jgi:hypothetical protein